MGGDMNRKHVALVGRDVAVEMLVLGLSKGGCVAAVELRP